jgi:indolepyruvate ferredoxin oxidoreductase beta subunit
MIINNLDAMQSPIRFVLVGVGGQGTILASDVLAEVGLKLGCDVKQAEIHGMSQRGGSVVSNVVWAKQVFSPIVSDGEADVLVAFEKMEALRFLSYLKPGGLALINDYSITPVTVSAGSASYPLNEEIHTKLEQVCGTQHWVKGVAIAESLGNAKAANVVLLGALSGLISDDPQSWMDAISNRVPQKYLELNQNAFELGRAAVLEGN